MTKYRVAFNSTSRFGAGALDAVSRMEIGDPVRLERDRGNEHDANATRVMYLGLQIGWVPMLVNPPIAARLDAGRGYDAKMLRLAQFRDGRIIKEPLIEIVFAD